jgi:hypothetical protein
MYSGISPAARATAWLLADAVAQTPAHELPLLDGYVIDSPDSGRVKISFTTDVMRRLPDLPASSPALLRVLSFGNGTREIEERLHLRFHSHRTHGEWFDQRADLAVTVRQEALHTGATEVPA